MVRTLSANAKIITGGVTSPKGFLASGVCCGIKKSGKKDLALLYSQVPAEASGAFTTNSFAASPVRVSKRHLTARLHQAIIVNSGNANCANGRVGDRDAERMAHLAAKVLFLADEAVLVASTGIIGERLPIEKIGKAMPELVEGLSSRNGPLFAQTIITTDTVAKECCVKASIDGSLVTIGGAAKGVGMIYPLLETARHATMLCFITTDANISPSMLDRALGEAADGSFNMISVDGDMSTNDSLFILANALAGNKRIERADKYFIVFKDALRLLAQNLAVQIVSDGEGATKIIEVTVKGASHEVDARNIARKITASNLLKTCVYGEDPNWGRVIASMGASGSRFDPSKVDVYFSGTKVLAHGSRVEGINKGELRKLFKKDTIYIKVDLKSGSQSATAWTCDLSEEYVQINSAYST